MTDREQTRRDAERDPFADDVLERLIASNQDYQRAHGHYIVPLSMRLLKARAALEQAEREGEFVREQLGELSQTAQRYAAEARDFEARLASVPALVEALRKAGKDLADVGSAGWDSSRWRLRDGAVARVRDALTVYEQSQGKP